MHLPLHRRPQLQEEVSRMPGEEPLQPGVYAGVHPLIRQRQTVRHRTEQALEPFQATLPD